MYCSNCGKEIDEKAVICPACGVPTSNFAQLTTKREKTNFYAIAGFVLSFFIAIAGLILSIIGCKKAPEYDGNGKGLAVAGIVLSIVEMVIYVFAILFWIILLLSGDAPAVT